LTFTERIAGIPEDKLTTDEARKNYGLVLNARAFAFQNLDRVEEAEAAYEAAFTFTRKLGKVGIETLRNLHINRGPFRINIKDDKESALQDYKEALPLAKQLGDKSIEGLVTLNISTCQEGDERIETNKRAIKLFEKEGASRDLALAYINLADKLGEKGELNQATKAGERAFEISHSIDSLVMRGRSLGTLAIIANLQGNHALADQRLEEAGRLFEKVQNLDVLSLHYDNWIELCLEREDPKKGLELCEQWEQIGPISGRTRVKIKKRKEQLEKLQ